MTWGVLVLVSLAAYRLTRLVTTDELTEPLRHWVLVRFPPRQGPIEDDLGRPVPGSHQLYPSRPLLFVHCPWCVSMWTTLLLVLVAHAAGVLNSWQLVVLGWLATATVAGFLTRLER